MCKLLSINNLSKIDVNDKLLKKIARIMSKGQNDGLGFVITHENQKTVYHRGNDSSQSTKSIGRPALSCEIPTLIDIDSNSSELQKSGNIMLLMHSRTSTNEITLDATHPFNIKDNYFFAHNGVIEIPENHKYHTITNNDSEFLAFDFKKRKEKALQEFSGYAATIAIDNNKMKLFRDNRASIYVSFSQKLETFLFTTKFDDCIEITELLSEDFTYPELLADYTYLEIDCDNNIESKTIKRKARKTKIDKRLLEKSMGPSFDDSEIEDGDDDNYDNVFAYNRYDRSESNYYGRSIFDDFDELDDHEKDYLIDCIENDEIDYATDYVAKRAK